MTIKKMTIKKMMIKKMTIKKMTIKKMTKKKITIKKITIQKMMKVSTCLIAVVLGSRNRLNLQSTVYHFVGIAFLCRLLSTSHFEVNITCEQEVFFHLSNLSSLPEIIYQPRFNSFSPFKSVGSGTSVGSAPLVGIVAPRSINSAIRCFFSVTPAGIYIE